MTSEMKKEGMLVEDMTSVAPLTQSDLRDGLKILVLRGGQFTEARVVDMQHAPDLYGVTLMGKRGSKPDMFAREQLLSAAVSAKT